MRSPPRDHGPADARDDDGGDDRRHGARLAEAQVDGLIGDDRKQASHDFGVGRDQSDARTSGATLTRDDVMTRAVKHGNRDVVDTCP